ncbi:SH3 domain-containing protein [Sorangium sp. So ce1097]|uniref:SH3 domain-containing protein n=1 Tax=Sorangium sp. So ce1097 TaxID=3133330 RepID=UPI003F60E1AD
MEEMSAFEQLIKLQRQMAALYRPSLAEQLANATRMAQLHAAPQRQALELGRIQQQLAQIPAVPGVSELRAAAGILASVESANGARIWRSMQSAVRLYTLSHLALGSLASDVALLTTKDGALRKILRMLEDTRAEPALQPLTALLQQVVAMEEAEGAPRAAEELFAGLAAIIAKVRDEIKAHVPIDRLIALISLLITIVALYYTMATPQWAVEQSQKLDAFTKTQAEYRDELRRIGQVVERAVVAEDIRDERLAEIAEQLSQLDAALATQMSAMHELATEARIHTRRTGASGVVGVLARGTVVEVLERHGRWSRVRAAATTGHVIGGWIPSRALKRHDE